MSKTLLIFTTLLFSATDDFSSTGNLPSNPELYDIDNLFQNNMLDKAAEEASSLSESFGHLPYERLSMLYLKSGILDSSAYYATKTMAIVHSLDDFEGVTDIDKVLEKFSKKVKSAKKSQERNITEEAIREYNELLNIFPDFSVALYELGNIYYLDKDFERAIDFTYRASKINPLNENYEIQVRNISKNFYKDAETQRKQKRYSEALENYLKAVEYYPEFSTAWFQMARVLYVQKEYERSISSLKKCTQYNSEHYQAYKLLGDIYYRMRDNDKASDAYSSAISINSNYYQAFYSRGNLFLSDGNYERSIQDYLDCINLKDDYTKAYVALGIAYMNISDYEKSESNLNSALYYDSNSHEAYFRLSQLFSKKGDFDMARFHAKNALDKKSNYPDAIYELALAEIELCNKVAAKDNLNKLKTDRRYRSNATNYLKNFAYFTKHCKK